jgi:predicted metal-dependent HD superfamily phosphohydrolase
LPDLLGEWTRLLSGVVPAGADPAAVADAGRELLRRWSEPHRRYHDVEHLATVLSIVDELGAPAEVRLAAWYHDAVYDPRSADNEERSARLAVDGLTALGVARRQVDEVARLVRLTAGHDPAHDDINGALLCDADLAVLARSTDDYDRYAAAIREEYSHVPEDAFRAGRAAVLQHLLDLPALYRLPRLHSRWEEPARANLRRELNALS